MAERLYRSRDDRMLAGVAGGVADALDADPSLVRIVWALLTILTGGVALVVYIVMAIVVPEAPAGTVSAATPGPSGGEPGAAVPAASARRARTRDPRDRTRGGLVAGLILIVIGGFFLVREIVPWFDWQLWWPIGLIALGGLLVVLALLPGRSSD